MNLRVRGNEPLLRADESHIEPEGQAVDGAGLQHGEAQRNSDHVQVRLVTRAEVNRVFDRLRQTRADVKGVLSRRRRKS